MAVSAGGNVSVNIMLQQGDTGDLSIVRSAPLAKIIQQVFTSGTGLNQIDRLFVDERQVAGSGTDALDFNGGGLTDVLNAAWAPARLKFLAVLNLGPNDIQVVRPASNGMPIFLLASGGVQIPTNGFVILAWPSAAGVLVTAGTGDLLNVINTAAGTVTYQAIAAGGSA